MKNKTQHPFAVFVVAQVAGGLYAATTRAKDRGEAGRIGLPGGKVDPGESPEQAAIREAAEEGWRITGPLRKIHEGIVEGRLVWWFAAPRAEVLVVYKEQGRITPVEATLEEIASSGYGNEFLRG